MKISYRTHPILEKLATKTLGDVGVFECDHEAVVKGKKEFNEMWKRVSIGINHQIYSLSQPFVDAFEKAGDKLFSSDLWEQVEDDNICFLAPWNESTCLRIRNNIEKKVIYCEVVGFAEKNIIGYAVETEYDYSSAMRSSMYGWVSANLTNIHNHILNCVLITLFIKYADVQTKYLPAGSKDKDISCKYVNETKMPVTILDSTWFTNLIKSDAFKVRGHFRLQPCGEALKDRKLIWIKDFEKQGYTRQAGKLS